MEVVIETLKCFGERRRGVNCNYEFICNYFLHSGPEAGFNIANNVNFCFSL